MTAGHFFSGDPETFARDPLLELHREKAIVTSNEDVSQDGGPAREAALGVEHCVRLMRLSLSPSLVDHGLRHVVEELEEWIERLARSAALATVLLAFGLVIARVPPPLAGGFAGPRDHGVDQHQERHVDLLAHQRRGEAAERLGNEHQA